MNRRELLKNASRLLGLAVIAPFVAGIKDGEVEFENEPNYHEVVTGILDEKNNMVGLYCYTPEEYKRHFGEIE